MELERAGNILQIGIGGNGIPKLGIFLRGAVLLDQGISPRARIRRWYCCTWSPAPLGQEIGIRSNDPTPDYTGLDVIPDHHRTQGDIAAHGMAPHADTVGIGVRIALDRRDRIQHVHSVVGVAVCASGFAFGPVVATIVGAEDNISAAGDQVHISDVTFCGDIHLRRDITMVEDDHRPAGRRLFTMGTVISA